jgi:hypothetical protein
VSSSDDTADSQPAIVSVPRPRENRDPWLRIVPDEVATPPPAGQPGHGSGVVLRRQPVRIVDGQVEGGYTDMYELICPSCGDHRDLNYSEVSPRLQWLRGPHRLEAGLAVFHKHQGIPWPPPGWKL